MRHRIANAVNSVTGLGNPSPALMDGKSTGNKERDKLVNAFSKDVYQTFLKGTKLDYQYCDAGVHQGEVKAGIEPSYMYEPLKIIIIDERKELSRIVTGYAWGLYGSGIRATTRYYKEYTRSSKFTRFVDKWHKKLFNNDKETEARNGAVQVA